MREPRTGKGTLSGSAAVEGTGCVTERRTERTSAASSVGLTHGRPVRSSVTQGLPIVGISGLRTASPISSATSLHSLQETKAKHDYVRTFPASFPLAGVCSHDI